MKLSGEDRTRLAKGLSAIACIGLVAGCSALGGGGGSLAGVSSAYPENGPQADYPVLVGEPYAVAGTTFTPSDTLNYDEVGYLAAEETGAGITGAHHTLPVPSYVEVTSLTSGRTVLVRVERRGPMNSTHLLGLSPAAMAQLQGEADMPVRVRRVNPPEAQRAMLRAGGEAPLRMDTPRSLVNVLLRQIPSAPASTVAPMPELVAAAPVVPEPASQALPPAEIMAQAPDEERSDEATAQALPALRPLDEAEETGDSFAQAFGDDEADPARQVAIAEPLDSGFVVQAAAFSTPDRAARVADVIGGKVTPSGRFFRVRTGPFLTRSEAEASLANVRAAGYTDARILTSG